MKLKVTMTITREYETDKWGLPEEKVDDFAYLESGIKDETLFDPYEAADLAITDGDFTIQVEKVQS